MKRKVPKLDSRNKDIYADDSIQNYYTLIDTSTMKPLKNNVILTAFQAYEKNIEHEKFNTGMRFMNKRKYENSCTPNSL